MTDEEKYIFDVQGYLVLSQVLSPDLVGRLNREIDHLESVDDEQVAALGAPRSYERNDVYAQVGQPPAEGLSDYVCPVLACGGPFEELIDHPKTIGYIEQMIEEPLRLDSAAFLSRNSGGGFRFHHGHAELLPYCEYFFEDGRFKCVSIKVGYALSDVGVADGCFAVIAASHKSNFSNPFVGELPDPAHPLVEPLACQAGDAIIFSEDLSHGAVTNRRSKVRRTLFYSYAPSFHCPWTPLLETAEDFEQRASKRRLELVKGPPQSANV